MTEEKKMKVTFAPGCFDNFDGTQEELDALVAEIQAMADSGELENAAVPVDIYQDLSDVDEEELQDALEDVIKTLIQSDTRTLH